MDECCNFLNNSPGDNFPSESGKRGMNFSLRGFIFEKIGFEVCVYTFDEVALGLQEARTTNKLQRPFSRKRYAIRESFVPRILSTFQQWIVLCRKLTQSASITIKDTVELIVIKMYNFILEILDTLVERKNINKISPHLHRRAPPSFSYEISEATPVNYRVWHVRSILLAHPNSK